MRYFYPTASETDHQLLSQELRKAGIDKCTVHYGSGVILVETTVALDEGQKSVLDSVIQAHSPKFHEWTNADGQTLRATVNTSQDVDRITARRIRETVGGEGDPVQEQLKIMRKFLWALDVMVNGKDYSAEQVAEAGQIRTSFLEFNDRVAAIVHAGKKFKKDKELA